MIRNINKNDIQQIINICKKSGIVYDIKPRILAHFNCNNIKSKFYINEDNGLINAVFGFRQSWIDDSIYEVFGLYVLPDYRGNGIGTALLTKGLDDIYKLGGKIIIGSAKETFVEKFGFQTFIKMKTKYKLVYKYL